MEIISRNAAQVLGLKRYFTGEPCLNGHICERYSKNCKCVSCATEYHKFYIKYAKPGLVAISDKKHRSKPEVRAAQKKRDAERYAKDCEKFKMKARAYRSNPKNSEKIKMWATEWRKNNPDKIRAYKIKERGGDPRLAV